MLKVLKFTKSYDKYNTAEIAGFENDKADKIIKQGVAKLYQAKNKAMSKPKVDKMVKEANNKEYTIDDCKKKKGGWYELPNGESVRGKTKVKEALEELNEGDINALS